MPSSVSTQRLIKHIPIARDLRVVFISIIVTINILEVIVSKIGGSVFKYWIDSSQFLVDFASRYVPVLSKLPDIMLNDGYGYRIQAILNVISLNFITYLCFLIPILITIVYKFYKCGKSVSVSIRKELVKADRSVGYVMFGYFVLLVFANITAFTTFGYAKPVVLYRSNVQFLLIWFWFYCSLDFLITIFIISISSLLFYFCDLSGQYFGEYNLPREDKSEKRGSE